jgi:NTE family protein
MKGIGLGGAIGALMRAGYAFERVAGTSVGALAGALVAAGISERGLAAAMARLRFRRVPDRGLPRIPLLSEGISLLHNGGAYEGDYIHGFVRNELEALGVRTFGDLRRSDPGADANLPPERSYKLVVMATDVTNGRLLRLPWDYGLLGMHADEQLVADAVRASISIPLYFDPVVVRDAETGERVTLVDGGVLSNYPIEIFDRTDLRPPRWPTFGVKVVPGCRPAIRSCFPGSHCRRWRRSSCSSGSSRRRSSATTRPTSNARACGAGRSPSTRAPSASSSSTRRRSSARRWSPTVRRRPRRSWRRGSGRRSGASASPCRHDRRARGAQRPRSVTTAASPAPSARRRRPWLIFPDSGAKPGQLPSAATARPSIRTCGASSARPAPVGS